MVTFFFKFLLAALFAMQAHGFHDGISVSLYGNPDEQVVAAVGVIDKVHRRHGDVVHTAKPAFIPRMDMPPERDGRFPVGQFVQDVIQFLAAIGRGELVQRRPEDIGVGKGKGVADLLFVTLEETILNFINLIIA